MTRCLASSIAQLVVVTLVKDDAEGLERTVGSLDRQERRDFAHLIVDGGSATPTLAVIRRIEEEMGSEVLPGPDAGIYFAMNRALSGLRDEQWVLYLNSGDSMSGPDSIDVIMAGIADTDSRWAFAPVIVEEADGTPRGIPASSPFTLSSFAYGKTKICHQAVVAQVGAIREVGLFRTDIPNCADFDLLLRMGDRFPPSEWVEPFSIYRAGGGADQDAYRVLWRQGAARRRILTPTGTALLADYAAVGRSLSRVFVGRQVDRLARAGVLPVNWRSRAQRHNRTLGE